MPENTILQVTMKSHNSDRKVTREEIADETREALSVLQGLIKHALREGEISLSLARMIWCLFEFEGDCIISSGESADNDDKEGLVMKIIGTIYIRFGELLWDEDTNRFIPQRDPVRECTVMEAFEKLNQQLKPNPEGRRLPIISFHNVRHELGEPPFGSDDLQAISEFLMRSTDGDVTFNHHFPDLDVSTSHASDQSPSE